MISFKRHPKALPFLFLTEMWERFGFYTVQGLLVLYMTKAFGFTDDESYTISGVFAGLAYISPMLGGLIADRLLGFKLSISWGGIYLIVGYALLATPWEEGFYVGLATIIVGNGLFKPNISSLLGALYPPGDTARDAGFTLFYIGINIGALLSGMSGAVKNHFGWHAAFGMASIGLCIGLITFIIGLKWGGMHYTPYYTPIKRHFFLRKRWLVSYSFVAIALLIPVLQSKILGNWLLPIMGIFLLFYLLKLTLHQEEQYRQRLVILIILILSSIVFWMIALQIFFSANLFIDRLVNKHLFAIEIPTTAFYSLESVFIILLGPMLAWLWDTLHYSNRNPSPLLKFVIAIVFLGLGFLTLAVCTYFPGESNLVNPAWIVLSYFLLTIGEMLLSPIGLSAVTTLAPPHLTGLMMGIWFVALGFGGQFAGFLAKISSVPDTSATTALQLAIYRSAFFDYACIAFGVAILLFLIQFCFRRYLKIV